MKINGHLKRKKTFYGVMLIELVIAISLFALGMVTMSLMYFAFLSGNKMSTYGPHANRLQMEVFSRELDRDFQTYRPVFAFQGEVRDAQGWIGAGPITLDVDIKPYDVTQQDFLTQASPNLTLVNNTDTRQAFTLIFIGPAGGQTSGNQSIINVEVVYQLLVVNDPDTGSPERILYQLTRAVRDDGSGVRGFTHQVSFSSEGFSLPNNSDQVQIPAFIYQGNNLISVILPNPFSKATVNPLTSAQYYFNPLSLDYDLSITGLYAAP